MMQFSALFTLKSDSHRMHFCVPLGILIIFLCKHVLDVWQANRLNIALLFTLKML